jgi:glycosyltransferase involved in cell wall biosynthesis
MQIIDLSPQASIPPMDGADKRAWHLYEGMVQAGIQGTFVGRTMLVNGLSPAEPHSPSNSWRERKAITALVALATGQDYWQVKHLLPGSRRLATVLAKQPYDLVLISMLYSFPLAESFVKRGIRLVVDTHNYDPAWFGALAAASKNPGLRHLCRRAARNSQRTLTKLPIGTVLVHVSEADANRYRSHRPDLAHVVVENGTTVRPRVKVPSYDAPGKRILIFVGSLSAQMNQDALRHFATCFWPKLRDVADFRVVGSSPSSGVQKLCQEKGWALHSNVTEEQLKELYEEAHFAVLPFAYGEGSKLKFLEACGRGVPILATRAGLCGFTDYPKLVVASDIPQEWFQCIQTPSDLCPKNSQILVGFAERFSWDNLSDKLLQILQSGSCHADSHHYESIRTG